MEAVSNKAEEKICLSIDENIVPNFSENFWEHGAILCYSTRGNLAPSAVMLILCNQINFMDHARVDYHS